MAKTCSACGASLAGGQAFCSSCGTKWVAAAEPEKKFCVGCGSPLAEGTKFCAKCGMAVQAAAAASGAGTYAAGAAPAPAATQASIAAAAPQKSGSGMLKVIVTVLGFFMFIGLLGMGSCAYIAYRAKQKVEGLKDEYENNPADKYASALENQMAKSGNSSSASSSSAGSPSSSSGGSTSADTSAAASLIAMAASAMNGKSSSDAAPQPELPHWKSYSGSPVTGNSSLVPLKVGLTEVGAVNDFPLGDYEAIVTVNQIAKDGVVIAISSEAPPKNSTGVGGAKASTAKGFQGTDTRRKVLAQDLANAHEVNLYFSKMDPFTFPGTTSETVSKEVFNDLKTKGKTAFSYKVFTVQGALTGFLNKMTNPQSGGGLDPQNLSGSLMTKINCTLSKAEANDVGFPVIMNDKPVELPAIHTVCKSDQDEFNLWILDDAQYPINLAFSTKLAKARAQVVKINFPEDQPVNHIEQALKQTGHAQVYGINFDFASATIRPQSQPILAEIAKAMKDNPSWKLSVNGHTDNIGGDTSNLELSRKRAAAVVTALTTQYHIAGNRFTSAGFGESQPLDTNDTIEGRARNRRVELVLQ
ncbi:MAG: OmpA family protein [Terriglobia bacterium]|nr:OmpA family protein [Terriglobia bacterium]